MTLYVQNFDWTMTISFTILGGGVKQKVSLHDKGGRGDEAKSDLSDRGGGGRSRHPPICMPSLLYSPLPKGLSLLDLTKYTEVFKSRLHKHHKQRLCKIYHARNYLLWTYTFVVNPCYVTILSSLLWAQFYISVILHRFSIIVLIMMGIM